MTDAPTERRPTEGRPDERRPTERRPIGVTERVIGLGALAAVLVAAGFGLQALRGPGSAVPVVAPEPSPTYTPVEIPDEARTSVHRSDTAATGTFLDVDLTLEPTQPAERTNAYTVRVEEGTNLDPDATARAIQAALDDPRGWAGFGRNNFRLVAVGSQPLAPAPTAEPTESATGEPTENPTDITESPTVTDESPGGSPSEPGLAFTITVASPDTTDRLCGPDVTTEGLWSCTVGQQIVLNSDRWHYMVPNFNNLDEYRAYLVNHQVGLFLGQRIAFCTAQGEAAPVMAQQERDLAGCLPNAWPHLV